MKNHIVHSLKYLLKLCVLFAILFALMKAGGWATTESFSEVLLSTRGIMLCVAVLILAGFYPKFGFVTRRVQADMDADRDKILKVFDMGDYGVVTDEENRMTLRARGMLKRVTSVGEDPVTVTRDGDAILISGLRKEVVKAEYRLRSML